MSTTNLYDRASDTVRDWAGTVRDEMPGLADAKDAVESAAERAGDWVEDTAERLSSRLPAAAARAAARKRRRRWIAGGLAVAVLIFLFGPGGGQRRASLKSRFVGRNRSENRQ